MNTKYYSTISMKYCLLVKNKEQGDYASLDNNSIAYTVDLIKNKMSPIIKILIIIIIIVMCNLFIVPGYKVF
jgi:hypothetical protein